METQAIRSSVAAIRKIQENSLKRDREVCTQRFELAVTITLRLRNDHTVQAWNETGGGLFDVRHEERFATIAERICKTLDGF